jgi:predicted enzyme related to lactoylglutathione lyase
MEQHAIAAGKTFPWHELYAPNQQAAIDFYTQALGMGTQDYDMGNGFTYKMLVANGMPIAGIMDTSTPEMTGVPTHWSVYMAVDDVDVRLEKCKSMGATVVHGPMDVPNVGRMVLIADPQGAHIWLFKGTEG